MRASQSEVVGGEPPSGFHLDVRAHGFAMTDAIRTYATDHIAGRLAKHARAIQTVVVRFDVDVHLSRGVRIENNLARTDLKGDVKVTGTSRAVGLLGSINTVHGTATFRGNEFQIEQGVLTFTDRQHIRPSFDLQASTQVKSGGQDYKVRLHAFGTPGEP